MGKVDKGTVETRTKLSPDPIVSLLKAQKIDLDHVNAVDEIDCAYRYITEDVSKVKVHVMERMSPSHKGDYQSYNSIRMERMFKDWANKLIEHGLNLSAVLSIAVYRQSPHQVDRQYKQRNGKALENFVEALDLYCCLRGWKR